MGSHTNFSTYVDGQTSNSHFSIGNGVGVVGRWFRLFIGTYFVVFLVINPILVNPIPRADLMPFMARVGLDLALITAIYFAVFFAIGKLVLSKMNPWTGTLVFLGTPTLLFVLGVLPQTLQVALGLYVSLSLILTYFMRYGGCEVVALPSVLLRRRYTMYCPYNAVDAVERAVSLDVSDHRKQFATIVSLAIVVFVGGYFFLVETQQIFGRYGIAIDIDNRWAFLLLIPILHLWKSAWNVYRSTQQGLMAETRNYMLGAVVLLLVMLIFGVEWLSGSLVWRSVMVLGGLVVLGELVRKGLLAPREARLASGDD